MKRKYIVKTEIILPRRVVVDIPPEGVMDRARREMEKIWGPYPTEWTAYDCADLDRATYGEG